VGVAHRGCCPSYVWWGRCYRALVIHTRTCAHACARICIRALQHSNTCGMIKAAHQINDHPTPAAYRHETRGVHAEWVMHVGAVIKSSRHIAISIAVYTRKYTRNRQAPLDLFVATPDTGRTEHRSPSLHYSSRVTCCANILLLRPAIGSLPHDTPIEIMAQAQILLFLIFCSCQNLKK
jgi:hypothetical protein